MTQIILELQVIGTDLVGDLQVVGFSTKAMALEVAPTIKAALEIHWRYQHPVITYDVYVGKVKRQ